MVNFFEKYFRFQYIFYNSLYGKNPAPRISIFRLDRIIYLIIIFTKKLTTNNVYRHLYRMAGQK